MKMLKTMNQPVMIMSLSVYIYIYIYVCVCVYVHGQATFARRTRLFCSSVREAPGSRKKQELQISRPFKGS